MPVIWSGAFLLSCTCQLSQHLLPTILTGSVFPARGPCMMPTSQLPGLQLLIWSIFPAALSHPPPWLPQSSTSAGSKSLALQLLSFLSPYKLIGFSIPFPDPSALTRDTLAQALS